MNVRDKIKKVLEGIDAEDPVVFFEPGPRYRVVAVVVSPSFETMDEGERQKLVWGAILDGLSDHEQGAIDTVFTFAPSEPEAQINPEELTPKSAS